MDLFNVLLDINGFCADEIIYFELPLSLESQAKVIAKPIDAAIKVEIEGNIYVYFLDIFMVKVLLSKFETQNLCIRDTCQRIIEYVIDHT